MDTSINPIIISRYDGDIEVAIAYKLAVKLEACKSDYDENGPLNLNSVFPALKDMGDLKKAARMFLDVYNWIMACVDCSTAENAKIYSVKAYPDSDEYLTLDSDRAKAEAERKNTELDVTWVTPAIKQDVTLYYPD